MSDTFTRDNMPSHDAGRSSKDADLERVSCMFRFRYLPWFRKRTALAVPAGKTAEVDVIAIVLQGWQLLPEMDRMP